MKHLILSFITLSMLAACDCASCKVDTTKTEAAASADVNMHLASHSTEYAFSVKGMHCNGCANSLTQVINECDGVMTVAVSFENSNATVNVRSPDALACAIAGAKELGYETGTPEAIVWDAAGESDPAG